MTAISLLNILWNQDGSRVNDESRKMDRAASLAAQMVQASLLDWERICEYETKFASDEWNEDAFKIECSIHDLFSEWISEAGQVLASVRRLIAGGVVVPRVELLDRAIGRTARG